MSDSNVVEIGIDEEQELDFDQVIGFVQRNDAPTKGVVLYFVEGDPRSDVAMLNFGSLTKMEALWLSERMKEIALEKMD